MLVILLWPPLKRASMRFVHDLGEEFAVRVCVVVTGHALEDRHLELPKLPLELHGVPSVDQVNELHVDAVVIAHLAHMLAGSSTRPT